MDLTVNQPSVTPNISLWRSIWFHPRATVRYALAEVPLSRLILMSIPAMILIEVTDPSEKYFEVMDVFTLAIIVLFMAIAVVPLIGMQSWLLKTVGRWFGSQATTREVFTVLLCPAAIYYAAVIGRTMICLSDLYQAEISLINPFLGEYLSFLLVVPCLICGWWVWRSLIIGMSEAMQISEPRVFGISIITGLVSITIWILLSQVIPGFFGA